MSCLVSIIVPVYKVEPYIRQCIESVLNQTFTDFELLLVNDGSPDNCGVICDEYAKLDTRVRVFHKENGGVSKARNLGLDNARGKYVCFVDSDDWVETDMLENLIGWEQKGPADLSFYGFTYETLGNCTDNLKLLQEISGEYSGIESIIKACYFLEKRGLLGWTWNKLFRNSIIQEKRIRFNEKFAIQEDHLFTLDYLKYVMCLRVCAYAPYHYRMLQSSLIYRPYSYVLQKEKLNLLFQGRMRLMKQVETASSYQQYAVREFLLTLLYYYCTQYFEIEHQAEEVADIRKLLRKYAWKGQSIRMYILYSISFLPVRCLNVFFVWYGKGRGL